MANHSRIVVHYDLRDMWICKMSYWLLCVVQDCGEAECEGDENPGVVSRVPRSLVGETASAEEPLALFKRLLAPG